MHALKKMPVFISLVVSLLVFNVLIAVALIAQLLALA